MTDPRLLLPDTRLDEIERDAAHSRRLGLTVTFAVVNEQLALVHELRRLRLELAEARSALARLRSEAAAPPAYPHPPPSPAPTRPTRATPIEVEVVIVQRDDDGRELSRVRQRVPVEEPKSRS